MRTGRQHMAAAVAAMALCAGLVGAPAAESPAAATPAAPRAEASPSLPAIQPWSTPAPLSGSSTATPLADLDATYGSDAAAAVWTVASGTTVTVQGAGWADGAWYPAQTLDSATPTRAGFRPTPLPAVAMAEDARQGVAVWLDGGDAPYALKAATWTVNGWTTPVTIAAATSSAPALGVQPQVAIADDGSSAVVTWVARGAKGAYATQGYVYASTWAASSNAWSAGINLSNDGATMPAVAVSATGITVARPGATLAAVAWTAYSSILRRNQIQFRTLSGTVSSGWTSLDSLDNAPPEVTFDALQLSVSDDGRSAALGYTEVGILETSVRVAIVSGQAAPWPGNAWRARQLSTQNAGDPAVLMPGGGSTVLAAWPQEVGNDMLLLGSAWTPTTGGAGVWSAPRQLTAASDPDAALPQLDVAPDGSAAALAFCYQSTGLGLVSYTAGSGWGRATPGPSDSGCYPQVGLTHSGATTLVAWSGGRPGATGTYVWGSATSTAEPFSAGTVTPNAGPVAGGATVTFRDASWPGHLLQVLFDGTPATVVSSSATLSVTAPPHAAGPVAITFLSDLGSAVFPAAFTYLPPPVITSFSPTVGPTTGGSITFVGQALDTAVEAAFGPTNYYGQVTSATPTRAQADVPAMPPGYYPVSLWTRFAGPSNTVSAYRVAPVPTISAVSPGSGPAGSTVKVTGSGFTGATSVTFGGTPGTAVSVLTDVALTVTTPARAAGTLDVAVTTPGGSVTAANAFTLLPPSPTLTGASPLSGPMAGGTSVTLRGTALTGATAVSFGGTPATSLTVVNDSTVTAVAPAHAAGTVGVAVTTAGGTVTRPNAFTYLAPPPPVVARVTPDRGPIGGGTAVTIAGTGFTGATSVTFGGSPAASFTAVDDSTVTAVAPTHAAGAVDVTVTTPNGSNTLGGGFTYDASVPIVTGVSPVSGPTAGGTTVSISGLGLWAPTQITFGGTPASFLVVNGNLVTAVTPAHAAGAVDVTVTTPDGTATLPGSFTYLAPAPTPALVSASPSTGPSAGGTPVTLTGAHLTGATTVSFGNEPATGVTVLNATTVTATAPAHAPGAVDVTVTTPDGSATLADGFTYLPPPPVVTRVEPDAGPVAGGTPVTIVGSALTGTTAVTIGGTPATDVTVVDDTTITAVSPAHAAATVDVVVTVPGGPATLANGFTYVAPPTPAITDVSPSTGTTLGGTQVTLTGTGFAGATSVTFDGVPGTDLRVLGATALTVTSPARGAGTVEVRVTGPGGTSAAATYAYVQPAPVIAAVSPESGTAGTPLTITGDNLTGTTAVTLGGAPASAVTVVDDQTVTATAPVHAPGSVDVVVTAAGGDVTAPGAFSYATAVLSSAAPASGSTAGGTAVTLTGAFLAGVTGVAFGGTAATDVIPVDATTITALTPAHDAGVVDVVVTLAGGAAATLAGGFTYLTPPTISGVTPAMGPAAGGQTVTITGAALTGAGPVTFGGQPAGAVVASATSITAQTPAGAPGSGDVAVTTPVGVALAGRAYTWIAAPRIDAVLPGSGPTTGGTALTITGANLSGATVSIGGSPASVVATSTSAISVATPPGSGTAAVTVTTVGGTATSDGAFGYVAPAPDPGPAPQPPVPPRPVPVTTNLTVKAKPRGTGRVRITARAAPAFGRSGTVLLKKRHKGRLSWHRVGVTPTWPNRGSAAVTVTVRVPRGKDTLRLRLPATARGTAATRTFTVKVR